MTDREQIESSNHHYILIGGPDAKGEWNLNGCTHFELKAKNKRIWCTHGSWSAELMYDDAGKLTRLRITDEAYKVPRKDDPTKWKNAPPNHPDRYKTVSGFKLTPKGIAHYSDGQYFT